jgi:hypothetical protein
MMITDFAAGPETRTGPDFTIIVEDRETKKKAEIEIYTRTGSGNALFFSPELGEKVLLPC